jgi:hypothetical protein
MATVSGVLVSLISKIDVVDATSIKSISGILTSNIPDWPGSGGGCETLSLGYTSGPPPPQACTKPRFDYQFDSDLKILYEIGELCGGSMAVDGFYSDGINIYLWNGGLWETIGSC